MKVETAEILDRACDLLEKVATTLRQDTYETLDTKDYIAVIRHFDAARKAQDRIKTARKAVEGIVDRLNTEQVPDIIRYAKETLGVKTPINLEGVGRITVSHRYSCSMPDKELGIKWLKDKGHGGLVQETVNAQTLAAFAKDLLTVQNKELPEDLFKVGTQPYTSITKG